MAKALPRNGELADQLDLLADLSEILDEESFKVIAYRRAATRIRESPLPVAELALDGKAKELPGIGKTIENKVVEVVEDGEMHALTRRSASAYPPGSSTSSGFRASGRRPPRGSGRSSGSRRSTGLKAAAEEGRLRELSGPGREERGEDPRRRSRRVSGEKAEPQAPAREGAARRAACRRRALGSSGGDRGLRGGKRAAPPRDRARPRPDRDLERSRQR